jgi:hypothetical protein
MTLDLIKSNLNGAIGKTGRIKKMVKNSDRRLGDLGDISRCAHQGVIS